MLDQTKINTIEAKAQEILLTVFKDESAFNLPIDIPKIAKTLDLSLKEGNFVSEEVLGAYDKASKTIYVSKSDTYERKVFTIAHEMGHFVLHSTKEKETFFRKDLILADKEEREEEKEANCFAANILMPKGTLIRYLELTKNIERLADLFGVSQSALLLRIKTLGLA